MFQLLTTTLCLSLKFGTTTFMFKPETYSHLQYDFKTFRQLSKSKVIF